MTELPQFLEEVISRKQAGFQLLEDTSLMKAIQTLLGIGKTYSLETPDGLLPGKVEEHAAEVKYNILNHRKIRFSDRKASDILPFTDALLLSRRGSCP